MKLLCSTLSLEEPNSNLVHSYLALGQKLPFEKFSSGFARPYWTVSLVLRCVAILKILCFCFISVHILAPPQWMQFINPEGLLWQLLGTWSKLSGSTVMLCPIKDEREKPDSMVFVQRWRIKDSIVVLSVLLPFF